ncbi:hypothetical protein BDV12DRAFT_168546 [Aspergillus spectabilis]
MGKGDRDLPAKTNSDRFRTPDKPASASKLKRAPARLGLLPDTPGPTSTSTSTASTSRSSKRNSTRSVQGQPTLTQIDFVTISQQAESDDYFDYVGDSEKDAREVIEIEDDKEKELDNGEDADYKPSSTPRSKRARSVRFDAEPPKPQKIPSSGEGKPGKARRKSGEKKGKGVQKDDKTLTQMNYVRRIVIEPGDDVKLEYAYITPKKKDSERQTANTGIVGDVQQPSTYTPEPPNELKRRKLSPALETKEFDHTEGSIEAEASRSPSTPQKSVRTEIPSSQSPESPGVASITSSQFRGATRSPQRRVSKALNEPYIEAKAPGSPEHNDTFHRSPVRMACIDDKPSHNLSSPRLSSDQRRTAENVPPNVEETLKHADEALADSLTSKKRPRPSQRTVVYETDAESDDDDFQDDLPDVPSSPREKNTADSNDEMHIDDIPDFPNTESQELPPLPIPEQDDDSGPLLADSNLLSDASICYQRVHPATQYPLEPVPTINTQKMAELFPEESNGLHTLSSLSQLSSPMKSPRAPRLRMVSQTRNPDQTQSESQGMDKPSTEVVPESSPVARHADGASLNRRAPSGRDVVVQVESSQPVDRIEGHKKEGQNSGPRGVLSRSQILTSSVMESIPIPAFWMSSQDSVGEPYSLPDTT